MKTIKLVVVLLITAFTFNSCAEEKQEDTHQRQENTHSYGQVVYYQAASVKLQVLAAVKEIYLEERGDENTIQAIEREELKLSEFMREITLMRPLGPIPFPPPIPDPCDVNPDYILHAIDGRSGSEVLPTIDEIAIGLNCMPIQNLSKGIITEGFYEVESICYALNGEEIGVGSRGRDDFGQKFLKYDFDYSGDIIVKNRIFMEDGSYVDSSFPAFID